MKNNGILIFVIVLTAVAALAQAEVTETGREATTAPVQIVTDAKVENPNAQAEANPAPAAKVEESVAAPQTIAVPKVEEPVVQSRPMPVPAAPVAAPVVSQESESKKTIEEDIRKFVNHWLTSWQSGDMETYRNCYASDFRTKGMDLNTWITYKTNVRQKSKNINIKIEDLKVSVDEKTATAAAVFMQHYSSSIFKGTVKKKLSIKKINNEWKINKETISPVK